MKSQIIDPSQTYALLEVEAKCNDHDMSLGISTNYIIRTFFGGGGAQWGQIEIFMHVL